VLRWKEGFLFNVLLKEKKTQPPPFDFAHHPSHHLPGVMEAEFYDATKLNQVSRMQEILQSCPQLDVNWRGAGEWTALHAACSEGLTEAVEILLQQPTIKVNQGNNGGRTPFLFGCMFEKVEVVKILLKDPRVDINCPAVDGCSPLWHAASAGNLELVKCLLLSGRHVECEKRGKWLGRELNPRDVAKEKGKTAIVELLGKFRKAAVSTIKDLRIEANQAGWASFIFFPLFGKKKKTFFHSPTFLQRAGWMPSSGCSSPAVLSVRQACLSMHGKLAPFSCRTASWRWSLTRSHSSPPSSSSTSLSTSLKWSPSFPY